MRRRGEIVCVSIICFIGLVLRTVGINYNFDIDELFSADLASHPFREVIVRSLQDRPHPPLHNILLSFWERMFGAGEASVRSLSVLCSILFLVLAYLLLRRFLSPGIALGMMALLAVSPFFVYYGQQARAYSLIAFLSAANLLAFLALLDSPERRRQVIVWSASCAGLVWAQYFGVLIIGIEMIVLLCLTRRDRMIALCGGLLGMGSILPWLVAAMGHSLAAGSDPLPHIGWIQKPGLFELLWFYLGIFGEVPGLRSRWLLLPLAALGVAFCVSSFRRKTSPPVLALTGIGIGMPVAILALSIFGPKPFWADRQLIGSAFAFVALLSLWIANCPRWLGGAILVGAVAWSAAAVPSAFPVHSKPPWREVVRYLDREHPDHPVLTTEHWVADPLAYYRRADLTTLGTVRPDQPTLLLCRPGRDADLARDSTPLRTWVWGRTQTIGDGATLRLYKVGR